MTLYAATKGFLDEMPVAKVLEWREAFLQFVKDTNAPELEAINQTKELGDEEGIQRRTDEYQELFANPFVAASRGYVDDVIMPAETRERVCRSFAMLRDKQLENPWRKHGNIPL